MISPVMKPRTHRVIVDVHHHRLAVLAGVVLPLELPCEKVSQTRGEQQGLACLEKRLAVHEEQMVQHAHLRPA